MERCALHSLARSPLAVALAADRFSAKQRKTLVLRFVVTDAASMTLELRNGRKRVARLSRSVGAGRGVFQLRIPKGSGRHTLLMTARDSDGRTATDRARVTVRK